MKVSKESYPFAPVNIKLETLKEYIVLHDLLCFLLESNRLIKLDEYIRRANNDSREDIYIGEIVTIVNNLRVGLYKIQGES